MEMRTLVLGAAAGLAVSMPGALAFSASPAVVSLHRSPAALPLRSASRKPQSVIKASLRSEDEPRRARPAVSLPAVLAVHASGTASDAGGVCMWHDCPYAQAARVWPRAAGALRAAAPPRPLRFACAVCIVSVRAWK